MKRNYWILLLWIALCSHQGAAQTIDTDKLDRYFDHLEANDKSMSSVAVFQNGQLVYRKSIGFADVENKRKATENTKYRIGSISKTFTAVLVLKAAEANQLKLEHSIDRYFPRLPNADKISIRDLLYHRSGLHNFTDDPSYLTWHTQAKTESEMLDIIAAYGSDFEPGSKAAYSNSNYVLLTYILQKAMKATYAELLRQYITGPAGLDNTYLGGKIDVDKHEALPYSYRKGWAKEKETDISIPLGAGGIVANATDLGRFSEALFKGKLLEKADFEQMKVLKDNFGMGLFQFPFNNKVGYGHLGGIDGFGSAFSYFPEGDVSFAFISNGTNFNNNDIALAVLSAVDGLPFDLPSFNTVTVGTETLDRYLGTYSSSQMPMKITFTRKGNTLVAQATGQPPLRLEALAENKFNYAPAGIVVEFNAGDHTMLLLQGGSKYTFTRD